MSKLFTATELREAQTAYQEKDDEQMLDIIEKLKRCYRSTERQLIIDELSAINELKLRAHEYCVRRYSDQRDGDWVVISW